MPGSRRRRRNFKDGKNSFALKMEEIERREREQRLVRQQRATGKITNSIKEDESQESINTIEKKEKSREQEASEFTTSFRRTKESPKTDRFSGRTSLSSRLGDIDAGKSERNRNYKISREHSFDNADEDQSSDDDQFRNKTLRHRKFSSRDEGKIERNRSYKISRELSFDNSDEDQSSDDDLYRNKTKKRREISSPDAGKRERNRSYKISRELSSDNSEEYQSSDDDLYRNKTKKRRKISSPYSKGESRLYSSPTRSKKGQAFRQERREHGYEKTSSMNKSNTHNSLSSQSSPDSVSLRQNSGHTTDLGSKKTTLNKGPSSLSMPSGRSKRMTNTPTSESDSDSDGSFNMLSLFKQRAQRNNEENGQETTRSDRFDDASRRRNDSKRGKYRMSLSEDVSVDEGEHEERSQTFRVRTKNKNDIIPRKRSTSFDDSSEDGGKRSEPRIQRSDSLSKKRIVHRYNSSSSSDDEASVPRIDNADEAKASTKLNRNNRTRKLSSAELDTNDETPRTAPSPTKTNYQSTIVDDDDGFMSDCEPSPAASKKRLKEEDKKPPKTQKKKTKGKKENEVCFSSEDDDERFAMDSVDALDDLHPNFENPKFGPYEPMGPLILSDNQNGDLIQVPASLNRYLAPFQKEGIRFMYECLARNSGVILGDEMGCGKTVQVISLLCALFRKTGTRKDFLDIRGRKSLVREQIVKVQKLKDQALGMGEVVNENIEKWKTSLGLSAWNPVMIIVPPTIVDTWKNAFETFSHFSVSFYSSKSKANAIESILYGSADILVVPKSAFQNETHVLELKKVKWKLIVIDEFHNFKNFKAKISIHLRELKQLYRPLILGMTGTPMQNNHTELWNLVDLVETNYFGTKEEFKNSIEKPITLGRHKCADSKVKAKSEAASAELRKGLNKIYIKREKKDVLKGQLPKKNEEFILCSLSPLQKEVYKHVIKLPDFENVRYGSRPCDCGINQSFFRKLLKLKDKAEQVEYMRTNKSTIVVQSKCCKKVPENPKFGEEGEPRIDPDAAVWRTLDAHCGDDYVAVEGCDRCPWCCCLPCLTKLNKLSSHIGLLQAKKTNEAIGSPAYIRYKKEREFAKVALAGVVDQLPGSDYDRNDGIMDDHFNLSGKLKVLDKLLTKNYNEKGKVLLFSHSTQSLDLIENWLKSRGSFEYLRMDGSTPPSRRQSLTDEFNNTDHIFLFLLSIKATGLGLNLTSANRVIMFDVSWNPSWEIQAQDRAHRIGQTRDVRVVRLISKGTIEEMIYLRQIYKEHLKQDTLEDHDDQNILAPRVFRGIQGDKYRKGELFGTENLFRFKEDGSFLHDIYNIRPQLTDERNVDSTGLEIHNSEKISDVLLGMTDEERNKVGETEDITTIQMMPEKSLSNIPGETRGNTEDKESNSANDDLASNEPIESKVSALNHQDLFRSDRGEAAHNTADDGLYEEMGGQTQAAYEIFETIKDDIPEDVGNVEDEAADDDNGQSIEPKERKTDKDENELPVKIKTEVSTNIDETQSPTMGNPNIGSRHTFPLASTRNANNETSTSSDTGRRNPEVNQEAEHTIQSIPALQDRRDDDINLAESLANNSNQNKNKVALFGCASTDDIQTEFSAADLKRPVYGKKKKKKKKSKKKKEMEDKSK